MPKPKRPHVASPDEIEFTRNGDEVIVEYADPKVATTHFKMGKDKLDRMTDEQLLDYWNDHVENLEEYSRGNRSAPLPGDPRPPSPRRQEPARCVDMSSQRPANPADHQLYGRVLRRA